MPPPLPDRVVLAIDTATATAVVALGDGAGTLVAEDAWRAGYRHGEELLRRIDRLLTDHALTPAALDAIVVGTGPGAFTGLRVGLATAKALARGLGRPIAGISTGVALLVAAEAGGQQPPLALLLPAGPSDRVLVHDGEARLLPGGQEAELPAGTTVVAVDLEGRAPSDALERGVAAVRGLGAALIALGALRLADAPGDDVARVVPDYVTLPRGVRAETGEVTWSHDRR